MLKRTFTLPCASPAHERRVSTQVVVPDPCCPDILSLAHESPLSGSAGEGDAWPQLVSLLLARIEG